MSKTITVMMFCFASFSHLITHQKLAADLRVIVHEILAF